MNPATSSPDNGDPELLSRMVGGDESALAEIYNRYAGLIYTIAARMLEPEEAEESVQEVFLKIWKNAGRYRRDRGSVRSWIVAISRNHLLDQLRGKKRYARSLDAARQAALLARDAAPQEGLVDQIANRQDGQQAVEALAALPPEQREAILLAFFTGLTHNQIASSTGWPLGTVKKRIRLGLQKLRRCLYSAGEDHVGELK